MSSILAPSWSVRSRSCRVATDLYAELYDRRARRIVDSLTNGNLTSAIDQLFDDEDPVAVVGVALRVVELLVLEQVKSVPEVVAQLLRLIDTWSTN